MYAISARDLASLFQPCFGSTRRALAHISDRVTVVLNTGIVVVSRGYYKKDIFGVAGLVKHRVGS